MSRLPEGLRLGTSVIHAGEPRPRIGGAVAMPLFQSSTFETEEGRAYDDIRYLRLSNTPNHLALHEKLAALEGAEAALVTASGMAAISATLLSLLGQGEHLLAQRGLYGGTQGLLGAELPRLGIDSSEVDGDAPATWAQALRPTTRVFYVESITNPLLEVADLCAVVAFAREHGLVTVIDNTFATPVNLRPHALGFDLVVHSATKYLNGHSDIVAGAVTGGADRVAAVRHRQNHLGGSLDVHACGLLHRGLKTLVLRMRQHNAGAMALAEALAGHAAVARVRYPGLPGDPSHARASALFDGFSGMVAFEPVGGLHAATRLLSRLRLAVVAPSLGGVETLVTRPAQTSHAGLSPEARARLGVSDGLVRVSVGIEDPVDLIEDFTQALG